MYGSVRGAISDGRPYRDSDPLEARPTDSRMQADFPVLIGPQSVHAPQIAVYPAPCASPLIIQVLAQSRLGLGQ